MTGTDRCTLISCILWSRRAYTFRQHSYLNFSVEKVPNIQGGSVRFYSKETPSQDTLEWIISRNQEYQKEVQDGTVYTI